MGMKNVYIGFAFSHHKNSQGGYHHIKEYLKYDIVIDAQWEKEFYESKSTNLFFRVIRRAYIFLLGQGTPFCVIRCIFLAIFYKNHVFHFVYAENSYKWLHFFIGKSNKIVCTFHQPASYFINNSEWIPLLKKIDKIILMADADLDKFKEWTGKRNVFFIPHGINTAFYSFDSSIVKRNSILMVGNWFRDFSLAASVFDIIIRDIPDIQINIVTSKGNYHYFNSVCVNFFSNIPDEVLKNLYQNSKLVFFPLKQFTANNAVLEAASCGCEIIISTPKNPDFSYFSDQYVNYVNNDKEEVVNQLRELFHSDASNSASRLSNYVNETFSWKVIGKRTEFVLQFS
jgi:glycosyltransferase involved in cell wall biosynthesis